MIHPSHFFEPIEGFIHSHTGVIQVAVLNRLATSHGCPEDLVDQVVNGAIADLIQACIAPMNKSVAITDWQGNTMPDNRISPTREELVNTISKQFEGYSLDRANKLLNYLFEKGALTEDQHTGKTHVQTIMVARQLIEL